MSVDEVLAAVEADWPIAAQAQQFRNRRLDAPPARDRAGRRVWSLMGDYAVDPMQHRDALEVLADVCVEFGVARPPAVCWFAAETVDEIEVVTRLFLGRRDWQHWFTEAEDCWSSHDVARWQVLVHVDAPPENVRALIDHEVRALAAHAVQGGSHVVPVAS